MSNTPKALGFSLPAEWLPHAAVWTAWPHDDDYWFGYLEPVRQEFATFINTLAQFEPVQLLVHDEATAADAKARLTADQITYHQVPNRDLWLRDSGPIFVRRGEELALTNWEFNGWGHKFPADLDNQIPLHIAQILGGAMTFDTGIVMEGGSLEVNNQGICLSTRQCLLAPTRNPNLSATAIEQALQDYLGIQQVFWLEQGLEGDHTDGHIDMLARFVDDNTIVCAVCDDATDVNYEITQANLAKLQSYRNLAGHPFTIVPLPLPQNRLMLDGERLATSYVNFYIANGAVLVPIYGDPKDEEALAILQTLWGDRQVIGLSARTFIQGGGAFHCATQQQPGSGQKLGF